MQSRELVLALVFSVLLICLSLASSRFFLPDNLVNILRQASINGVISVGMTMVILTAGIDLSVGSLLGLSAMVSAIALHAGFPTVAAVGSGLALGTTLGIANGLLITRVHIPPFVATLGMMTFARGAALIVSQGKPVSGFSDAFRFLGAGTPGGIPSPILVAAGVFLVGYLLLRVTIFGERIYAIGDNLVAARFAGIPTKRYTMATYAFSGLLSAIAGIMLIGRLNSAQPIIGQGYEFDAIAAVVVGGTRLSGGRGTLTGTLIGVLIIAVLNNGLNILNVSSLYEQVVKGAVIAIALLAHSLTGEKRGG